MYDSDENNSERSAGDIIFGLKRKYDNFWYYYKWHTLAGIAIIIFLIMCISQCVGNARNDANIVYIGAKKFESSEFLAIAEDFNTILGEDLDGDDKINVNFIDFIYMTATEIERSAAAGEIIDTQALMTAKKQIDMEIIGGDSVIYFLSYEVYKELSRSDGVFMSLEDALGYTPESATDDYCVKLSDLYCKEYFDGIYNFPDDVVIAVRDYQTTSKKEDKKALERYERNFKMLKKMIEFEIPQDESVEAEQSQP